MVLSNHKFEWAELNIIYNRYSRTIIFRPFFTIFPSFTTLVTTLHISTRNKKNQSGKPSTQSLVLLLRVSEGLMSDGCRRHRSFRACLESHLFPLLQIDEQQNKKLPHRNIRDHEWCSCKVFFLFAQASRLSQVLQCCSIPLSRLSTKFPALCSAAQPSAVYIADALTKHILFLLSYIWQKKKEETFNKRES